MKNPNNRDNLKAFIVKTVAEKEQKSTRQVYSVIGTGDGSRRLLKRFNLCKEAVESAIEKIMNDKIK